MVGPIAFVLRWEKYDRRDPFTGTQKEQEETGIYKSPPKAYLQSRKTFF